MFEAVNQIYCQGDYTTIPELKVFVINCCANSSWLIYLRKHFLLRHTQLFKLRYCFPFRKVYYVLVGSLVCSNCALGPNVHNKSMLMFEL